VPRKIVVTGGAGFVGSHLIDRLMDGSVAEVVAFDNLTHGRLSNLASQMGNDNVRVVDGDVRDGGAIDAALRGADIVFHLAGLAPPDGSPVAVGSVDEIFTSNVVGTFNVLKHAALNRVARVVVASSCEVYGAPITLPVEENHPLLPTSLYGCTMAAAEAVCRGFARTEKLEIAILRLAQVYGPRDLDRRIPNWIQAARAGETISVPDGKHVIDLVWVGDVVEALLRASTSAAGARAPINIASGTGTRLIDVARRIVRQAGRQGLVDVLPNQESESLSFVADVQRMRISLDLEPLLDPLIKLPDVFEWFAEPSKDRSLGPIGAIRGSPSFVTALVPGY